jgi:hypothetical protein
MSESVQWTYFPMSAQPSVLSMKVIAAFEQVASQIDSQKPHEVAPGETRKLKSNEVLAIVKPKLDLDFRVERKGYRNRETVVCGSDGESRNFFPDAVSKVKGDGVLVQVEGGRALTGGSWALDILQAVMLRWVTELVIAVPKKYNAKSGLRGSALRGGSNLVRDYVDALYRSQRFQPGLRGILILPY